VKRAPGPPAANEKPRQPGRIRAVILAVLVHAAFFGLIIFGVTWQSRPEAPLQAELWDKLPPQTAGEAYLLLARAEASDGRRKAAELSVRRSMEYFETAGAHQRAAQAGALLSSDADAPTA